MKAWRQFKTALKMKASSLCTSHMMFKRASKRGKGYMPCLSLRNGISLLLIFVLLAGIFPSMGIEAKAENRIVMTAGEFIGYLKIALSRNTVYNNKYPYNVGYYNGSAISWDCWDLGRSIIWTNGRIVNNYTKGKYATDEEHSGLSGNWDGWTIMQQCPDLSSDFTHLIPGEWLATANWGHIGYYIGNGQVIECTPDWGGNGVKQTQISSTGARSMNGISGRPWQWHGMVPWIDYSAYGERIYKENCTYKVIKSFTFKDDMYGAANSVGDPVPVGSYITVREVWKNKYGNMWVKTADNKWVYAGWKYESGSWCQDGDQYLQFYSDNNKVAWDDNNLDGQIVPYGKPYTLAGHITSDASMVSVQGEFMKGAACWGNPTSTFGAYGTSYDVPNSDLDHALSFAALPESAELGLRITVKYRYNRGFQLASKTIKCTFSNVQSTSPTGYLLDPVVFNLDYYLEANPDVKAMNWSADVVQKHWLQNGVSEGRAASPAFDVAYYVNQNADLQGFSGNYAGAIEHYCTNGVYELRPTSSIFNIAQYKTNYPDLAESLSNDDYEIAYHFVGAGYKEGRIANRPLMVYFDGNGGSVATGSKAIQKSRKYGTLPTPTRSGHSFDGWYTAASGGTRVTEDTIHDSIHELTLYAHWSKRMVTGIALSSTAISLNVGDVQTLSATVVPSDAYDRSVTWSTSDSTVATVSSGRITAVGIGTATITCAANDGSGKTASCTVTVNQDVFELDVNGRLDGGNVLGGCNGFGTFDVYIDGSLCADDVEDYVNREMRSGMTYEINDVKALPGYRYNGLCTSESRGGLSGTIADGDAYIVLDFSTVYAVAYDANGGSAAPSAQEKVKDEALTLSTTRPVRSGHTFLGWATAPDATAAQYQPGDSYTDNTGCTLYAVWKENAIGVAQIVLSENAMTLEVGKTRLLTATVLPENASNPAVLWSTSNASVATVNNGTVTAVGKGTATITCTANDGSGVSASCAVTVTDAHVHTAEMVRPVLATQNASGLSVGMRCRTCNAVLLPRKEVASNRILSLPRALKAVDAEAFAGAGMQQVVIPDGTTQIGSRAFANCSDLLLVYMPDSVKSIADDTFAGCNLEYLCIVVESYNSFAANYANAMRLKLCGPGESITIVLNANGGLCPETSRVIKRGDAIGTLPVPLREDYGFTGWYTAAAGGTKVTSDTVFDQPTTLYAQWEWCVGFIGFDANGGSCTETYKVFYRGAPIGELPVPTREYYSFDGWYTDPTGGTRVTEETAFDVRGPRLYAHWTQNTCVITFNENGGTCYVASKTIGCGDAIGVLPTATRTYYNFDGWFTAERDGSQVCTTTTFASSTTLYAHWTLKGYGSWSDWSTTAYSASSTRQVETKTESVQTGTKTTYSYDRYLYNYPVNGYNMSSYASNWATSQGYTGSWQYLTLDYALEYAGTTDGVAKYIGYYRDGNQYWWHQSVSTQPIYENVTYYRYRDLIE